MFVGSYYKGSLFSNKYAFICISFILLPLLQKSIAVHVCLMLGSNLGDRICLINKAIHLIGEKVGDILCISAYYHTDPWGTDHPLPYINLALSLNTKKNPQKVLKTILNIEKTLGRTRNGDQNAPRSIDIDMIFYENLIITQKNLTVPHPRMHLRRFVLVPLCEIEPAYRHPVFGLTVEELLTRCTDKLCVNISSEAC